MRQQQQYSWMDSYNSGANGSSNNKPSFNNLNTPDTTFNNNNNSNDISSSSNPSRRAISYDSPQIPVMRRGIDRESFQQSYQSNDFNRKMSFQQQQQLQQQQSGYPQNIRTYSSYQPQQSRIIVTADEEFEKLVREHVDFRDVRYQEFQGMFEEEMKEFDSNAIAFDSSPSNELLKNPAYLQLQATQSAVNSSSNYMQTSSNSAAMMNYSQLQSKFYASRKRDQKDIQERYERMLRVVRDSHVVDVRNLVSKFKGLLQEKTDKVLEEQRLKYEQENKEMREGHYALKGQIRNLEKTIEGLNQKLIEKDSMLQDSYNKILGINEQLGDKGKKRDQDFDNLNKQLKSNEKTISDLNAREKDSNDRIFKLSSQLAAMKEDLIKKEGEMAGNATILSQKTAQIKQLNNDLQSANNQLSAALSKLETAQDELAKFKTGIDKKNPQNEKNTDKPNKSEKPAVKAIKQEEIVLKPPVTPSKNVPVLIANKEIKKQIDKQQLKDTTKLKENNNNNNAPELLLLFKKNRRQEIQQVKAFVEALSQQIKLKEDQIKLLQVEVLALREQTDTYSQTLQRLTMSTNHRKNHSSNGNNITAKSQIRNQTKQFSPSLNDLLLIEGSEEMRTTPNEQYTLVNDENKFVSSVFSMGLFSPSRLKASQQTQQPGKNNNQLENQSYSMSFPSSTEQQQDILNKGENNVSSSTNSFVKSRSNSIRRNLYAITTEKMNSTRSSLKNNGIHINITYNSSINNNNSSTNSDTFSKLINSNNSNYQTANSLSANHFNRNGASTVFQIPSLLNSSNSFEQGSSFRATAFNFSTASPHGKNMNYTPNSQQQKQLAALRKSTPSKQQYINNNNLNKGVVSQQIQRQSSIGKKPDDEDLQNNNQRYQSSPGKSPSDSQQSNKGDKDSIMNKSISPKKQNKNNNNNNSNTLNSSTLFIPLNI